MSQTQEKHIQDAVHFNCFESWMCPHYKLHVHVKHMPREEVYLRWWLSSCICTTTANGCIISFAPCVLHVPTTGSAEVWCVSYICPEVLTQEAYCWHQATGTHILWKVDHDVWKVTLHHSVCGPNLKVFVVTHVLYTYIKYIHAGIRKYKTTCVLYTHKVYTGIRKYKTTCVLYTHKMQV